MKTIQIGLLDLGINSRSNGLQYLDDFVTYARVADGLGFSRLWMSEHHMPCKVMAWTSPTILVPLLATMTERIRIGVAGVLLSLYTPEEVAAQFACWNRLFEGRIDLGVASGTVTAANDVLITGSDRTQEERFETHLETLARLLADRDAPPIWSLSNGPGRSMARSITYGTHMSKAVYAFGSRKRLETAQLSDYRASFEARHGRPPRVNLLISGVCQTDEVKAAAALDTHYHPDKEVILLGSPRFFQEHILACAEQYDINEVIFLNMAAGASARIRSLELLSQALSLT